MGRRSWQVALTAGQPGGNGEVAQKTAKVELDPAAGIVQGTNVRGLAASGQNGKNVMKTSHVQVELDAVPEPEIGAPFKLHIIVTFNPFSLRRCR